jgi:glucose-6-phosphate isomerase
LKELKEIKQKAENREGLWAKLKKGPSEELIARRSEDIKAITKYYDQLKAESRGGKVIRDEPTKSTELSNLEGKLTRNF